MHASSSLTVAQRQAAVAWFEKGLAEEATARRLGVARNPVRRLYQRWQVRGAGALVTKATNTRYSFEFKLDLVQRHLAGEGSIPTLASQAGLSSPKLLENWVRTHRREGPGGLRPKPRGRRPASAVPVGGIDEIDLLRGENERLRAEVAFLGKLQALSEHEPQ